MLKLETTQPFTIIVGCDSTEDVHVQALHGAFPPTVLHHLIANGHPIALPTHTGDITYLHGVVPSIRIGKHKLDIDSVLAIDNFLVYKAKTKLAMHTSKRTSHRTYRGAVSRFARQVEAMRMLRRR